MARVLARVLARMMIKIETINHRIRRHQLFRQIHIPMVKLRLGDDFFIFFLVATKQQGNRNYTRCCVDADPECWIGIWVTADLCCHAMSQQQQQCFDSMESRVEAKLQKLHQIIEIAEDAALENEVYITRVQASSYEVLLAQPLSMWSWACSAPDSPLLWSKDCACCEPMETTCEVESAGWAEAFLESWR